MLNRDVGPPLPSRPKSPATLSPPRGLAEKCVSLVPLNKGDTVMDNAYGKGAFYDSFPSFVEKQACEVEKGSDFYEVKPNSVDWLVTNPPYSHLTKWLEQSCEVSRRGFGYLFGWANLTAPRIELCNQHGFYLSKIMMMKVQEWFGMSCFIIFDNQAERNIIDIDRDVWISQDEKTLNKYGNRERGSDKRK
jgi:hypothetical protein